MESNSKANVEDLVTFTNYKSKLQKGFVEMFHNKELTDAVLICESKRIHVHKFVLSASSSYFNNMFKEPYNSSKLTIKHVLHDDLLNVIEYIYNGQVALHPDKVGSFIEASHKLSVPTRNLEKQNISATHELPFGRSKQSDLHTGKLIWKRRLML